MEMIKTKTANAIRVLSADAIEKAKSGHPGLPLGCASIAYELWAEHMKHNPADPEWVDRDRFVLSGGHGSMLLYSLFHLFGYGDLSIDDIKNFRQTGSLTPGHPEYRHTVGVKQLPVLWDRVWAWQWAWLWLKLIWLLYLTKKTAKS